MGCQVPQFSQKWVRFSSSSAHHRHRSLGIRLQRHLPVPTAELSMAEFPASFQLSFETRCSSQHLSQQHQRPKPARLLRMSGTIGTECLRWPGQPVAIRPKSYWRHLGGILLDRSDHFHPKGSSWYGGWWHHDDHLTI